MLFPKSSTFVLLSAASLAAADRFENLYAREAYSEADHIALSKRNEIYARYAEPEPEPYHNIYERYAEPEPEYNDIYPREAFAERDVEFSARDLYQDIVARNAYAEAEAEAEAEPEPEPNFWDDAKQFVHRVGESVGVVQNKEATKEKRDAEAYNHYIYAREAYPEPEAEHYDIYAREAYPEPEPEPEYYQNVYAREAFPEPEPEPEYHDVYEREAYPEAEPEAEYHDIYEREAEAEAEPIEFSARDVYHDVYARDAYAEAEAEAEAEAYEYDY